MYAKTRRLLQHVYIYSFSCLKTNLCLYFSLNFILMYCNNSKEVAILGNTSAYHKNDVYGFVLQRKLRAEIKCWLNKYFRIYIHTITGLLTRVKTFFSNWGSHLWHIPYTSCIFDGRKINLYTYLSTHKAKHSNW